MVAICGDVLHSRVARSNIHLLSAMGARVRVVGPPTLMPAEVERLGVEVFHDMAAGLAGADVVMMLRLQQERMTRGLVPSAREYFRFYGLDAAEAGAGQAGRAGDASRPDEPRRRDRQRRGRRPDAQRDPASRWRWAWPCAWRCWTCCRGSAPTHDRSLLFANVRLLDPASGLDVPGELLVRDGVIADLGAGLGRPDGVAMLDGDGAVLCPGLVDMRAELGEPGCEYRETDRLGGAGGGGGRHHHGGGAARHAARRSTTRRWCACCAPAARRPAA